MQSRASAMQTKTNAPMFHRDIVELSALESGADETSVKEVLSLGFPLMTILTLVFRYGPTVWSIISKIVTLINRSEGIDWDKIQELATTEGAKIMEIVKAIAEALNISLGSIPPALR